MRLEAFASQKRHCVNRHHTVRAPAIGNDVAAFLQCAEMLSELSDRQGDGAWNVRGQILLTRSDVDERRFTGTDSADKLVVGNRFESAALLQILPCHLLNFRQPGFRQASQLEEEVAHLRVGESVRHVQASLPGFDQTRAAKDLEMVRRRGHTLPSLPGQRFDGPSSLR